MSKMKCRCGHVMVFRTGEEEYDLAIIPQKIIVKIGDIIQEKGMSSSNEFYKIIDEYLIRAVKCQNCSRLYIYNDEKRAFFPYIRECVSA